MTEKARKILNDLIEELLFDNCGFCMGDVKELNRLLSLFFTEMG